MRQSRAFKAACQTGNTLRSNLIRVWNCLALRELASYCSEPIWALWSRNKSPKSSIAIYDLPRFVSAFISPTVTLQIVIALNNLLKRITYVPKGYVIRYIVFHSLLSFQINQKTLVLSSISRRLLLARSIAYPAYEAHLVNSIALQTLYNPLIDSSIHSIPFISQNKSSSIVIATSGLCEAYTHSLHRIYNPFSLKTTFITPFHSFPFPCRPLS